tara:strand:+ start:4218 stop:4952 length:735 start_codon:yes stop_codon:yes gene_type:complete
MNTKDMRKIIVQAAHHAKHGHMPSALSLVEILKAYSEVQQKEDEIVLSKGHGCLALYAMLHLQGHVSLDEVLNFGKYNTKLGGHPDRNKLDQIYASTGSLGHGLPIAVGAAMARKIQNKKGNIFCIVGDGESNEGSIWESLLIAVSNKLNNLIVIIDYNKSQIRSLEPNLNTEMFKSFGCDVALVDGHDVEQLIDSMSVVDKPKVVLANTVKGKGIKEIEKDMFAWHHRAPTDEEYEKFIEVIG